MNSHQFLALLKTLLIVTMIVSFSNTAIAEGDKKHFPGIFIGTLDTDDETETTIGLEYEYKFSQHWGVGIVYEEADHAHHDDGIESTIGMIYLHPHAGWRLGLGLGEEKVGGDHSYTEDLTRAGVAYDFHLGSFGVAPTFNIDRVDGDNNKVYGVALTFPF